MTIKRGSTIELKRPYKVLLSIWTRSLHIAKTHFTVEHVEDNILISRMQAGKELIRIHADMAKPYNRPVYEDLSAILKDEPALIDIVTRHKYLPVKSCLKEIVDTICIDRIEGGLKLLHDINIARKKKSVALTDDSKVAGKILLQASHVFTHIAVSDDSFYDWVEHEKSYEYMLLNKSKGDV